MAGDDPCASHRVTFRRGGITGMYVVWQSGYRALRRRTRSLGTQPKKVVCRDVIPNPVDPCPIPPRSSSQSPRRVTLSSMPLAPEGRREDSASRGHPSARGRLASEPPHRNKRERDDAMIRTCAHKHSIHSRISRPRWAPSAHNKIDFLLTLAM